MVGVPISCFKKILDDQDSKHAFKKYQIKHGGYFETRFLSLRRTHSQQFAISLACHGSIQINFGGVVFVRQKPTSDKPTRWSCRRLVNWNMKIQTWTKFGWMEVSTSKEMDPHILLWKMVFTKKNHEDIISTTELWTKRWNCCKRIWTNKLLKFITDLISLHLEDKRPGASHRKLLRSTKWLSRTVTFSPVAKIELLEQVLHLLQN